MNALPVDKVPLTETMTHHIIEGLIRNYEIDRAIILFRDLRARNLKPKIKTFNLILSMCTENVEPEEAFRILVDLKETYGEEAVAERMWWKVLESSAQKQYVHHCKGLTEYSYLERCIPGNTF